MDPLMNLSQLTSSDIHPEKPGYTQKHRHTYTHSGGSSTFHPSLRNHDQESVLFTPAKNIPTGYDVMYMTPNRLTSVKNLVKQTSNHLHHPNYL
jgi:hypothetical protein